MDLPEFIKAVKDLGLKVKLDTNGTNPEMVQNLINEHLVDYIAMDIKTTFRKYELVGCKKTDSVIKTFNLLKEAEVQCEFRTTCPKSILKEEDFSEIARSAGSRIPWYLQIFNNSVTLDDSYSKVKSWSREELEIIIGSLKEVKSNIYIRG